MYKTQYKKAFEVAGETPETLVAKSKIAYDNTVNLEDSLAVMSKSLKDADDGDVETIQADIAQIEESLQAMDNDLCKRIEKNKGYKELGANLTARRAAKKMNGQSAPAKATVVAVVAAPVVKEKPKETEKVKPVVKVAPALETKTNGVEKTTEVETPAPAKKVDKETPVKVEKNGKLTTGEIVAVAFTGLLGLGALWFGLPIDAINKKAFTIWPGRK